MSITRTNRYQEGSIARVSRAKGPDVWIFRWREPGPDGRRVQRKKLIGNTDRIKTRSEAKRVVESLRVAINAKEHSTTVMTVLETWGHFQKFELRDPEINRSHTTIDNYLSLFAAHILPRWGSTRLDEVESVAVEQWLRALHTVRLKAAVAGVIQKSRPLSPATKAKIKSRLYSLFEHARRHKLCQDNPIETVRQGSKRLIKPDVLTVDEIRAIMREVPNLTIRIAVLVAGVTGLRRSEVRGLKWKDVDLVQHWIRPTQGSVRKHVTSLKTRASGEPIPIPAGLADCLSEWREQTPYPLDEDWVFASPATAGRSPLWFDSALVRQLRPAAKRAAIAKHIGWHTFRRSLATLLTSKHEGVKVVQELLRHSDARITLQLYAQGEETAKRQAQKHVARLFESAA